MAEGIIAILTTFGFAAFITFMFFSTRHKERMALIESGRDAGIFKSTPGHFGALKWGILLLFLGVGLGLGIFVDVNLDNDGPIATLPSVFVFGGLGLLLYYKIMQNQDWKDEV